MDSIENNFLKYGERAACFSLIPFCFKSSFTSSFERTSSLTDSLTNEIVVLSSFLEPSPALIHTSASGSAFTASASSLTGFGISVSEETLENLNSKSESLVFKRIISSSCFFILKAFLIGNIRIYNIRAITIKTTNTIT